MIASGSIPDLAPLFGDMEIPPDCLSIIHVDPRQIIPSRKSYSGPEGSGVLYDAAYAYRNGCWWRLTFWSKIPQAPAPLEGLLRPSDEWVLIDRIRCIDYADGRRTMDRRVAIFPLAKQKRVNSSSAFAPAD